jgi:hypothetical protein
MENPKFGLDSKNNRLVDWRRQQRRCTMMWILYRRPPLSLIKKYTNN